MNFRILSIAGIMLLSLLLWGCSDDDSGVDNNEPDITVIDEIIGPEGGSISIAGKIILAVPAGALDDTMTFNIEQNSNPVSPEGTLGFLAPVFSVEPTGTDFLSPAVLTIYYDDADIGYAGESSVILGVDTGDGHWNMVTATVDTINNFVLANISHLSDYAVLGDTLSNFNEGVYGIFSIARMISIFGSGFSFAIEGIAVRFDSAYAPCEPVKALHPDSITCDTFDLEWEEMTSQYQAGFDWYYTVLEPEHDYVFTVYGNADVPSLVDTIRFPSCVPVLSAPIQGDTVSKTGFDVNWTGVCGGVVRITLMHNETDSILSVEADNAVGSYTFDSAALSDLAAGEYGIVMVHQNSKNIDAAGYDSRSTIMARVMCNSTFYLKD
ncbi:MAG: hypothetical protein ACOYVF_04150 [Candidatus Zixiibacteriota bacterium]